MDRRSALGGTALPPTANYPGDLGADKYINIYEGSAVRIEDSNVNSLLDTMRPGAALVWPRVVKGADPGAGHIAVVEGVTEHGIWISQANWAPPVKFIPKEKLVGLYMIPSEAQPVATEYYHI